MVAVRSNRDLSRPAGKPPLRARLRAWWEGYELASPEEGEAGEVEAPARPVAAGGAKPKRLKPGEVRGWTPERLQAAQRLFGVGCTFAGGEAFIQELIKPLGLDESMSVVDLGAGIGTMARVIARETGAWVDAVEPNALLAGEAEAFAKVAGLSKKATVVKAPLSQCGLKPHSRDAVVSREAFYLLSDKPPLFAEAKRLLKPKGQLLFIDFMRKAPAPPKEDFEAWSATEPSSPHLAEVADVRRTLEGLAFDVRLAEDIGEQYCGMVLEALRQFAETLQADPVDPHEKDWLLWETDYWARRVAALQGGTVGLYRIYATLTA